MTIGLFFEIKIVSTYCSVIENASRNVLKNLRKLRMIKAMHPNRINKLLWATYVVFDSVHCTQYCLCHNLIKKENIANHLHFYGFRYDKKQLFPLRYDIEIAQTFL